LMMMIALVLGAAYVAYEVQGSVSIPMRNGSQTSVASILIHLTDLVSVVVVAASLRRFNPEYDDIKPTDHLGVILRWLRRAGTILAIVFVLTLLVIVALFVVSRNAGGGSVSTDAILVLSAFYAAVLGFMLAYWTSQLSYQQLLWFTSIAMLLG